MIVTAGTDLTRYTGRRVRIERELPGQGRFTYFGVFESLFHSRLAPGTVGGILVEEPHDTCKGGTTGFSVNYGEPITIVPTSTPPLHGERYRDLDLRYRIWTVRHGLDFDDMPSLSDGGPAPVVLAGWVKSVTVPCGWTPQHAAIHDGKVELRVWRGDFPNLTEHPLHGTWYDTVRDADRAAYQAGLIGLRVVERDAYRYPALRTS